MKIDEKIFLKQKFDNELPDQYSKDLIHLHTLLMEMRRLYTAIEIIKIVKYEIDYRAKNKIKKRYLAISHILYESLIYRIILGITKIFSDREKRGINKYINIVRYRYYDKNVQGILENIETNIQKHINSINEIIVYRDKLFGHLDKDMTFAAERIDITLVFYYIEPFELREIFLETINLYNYLFDDNFKSGIDVIKKESIIKQFFED